jgi:hypothetical protein
MLMAGLCAPSSSEVRCGVGGRTTGIGERALGVDVRDIAGVQSPDEGWVQVKGMNEKVVGNGRGRRTAAGAQLTTSYHRSRRRRTPVYWE